MHHITAENIKSLLPMGALISALKDGAQSGISAPPRSKIQIGSDSQMLIMPAHSYKSRMGVKLLSVFDGNRSLGLETNQGVYCLFDSENGKPLMTMDAAEITARRTAATSALAADLLAVPGVNEVAIAGAGKLLPYFMEAFSTVRTGCAFRLWARNSSSLLEQRERLEQVVNGPVQIFEEFDEAVSCAQIISTITAAHKPILFGDWIARGAHIDLVGGHTLEMAEADPYCFQRAKIFVDSKEAAIAEAGDLVAAIRQGVISESDIVADIFELASGQAKFSRTKEDVTLFKSVGHAFEDLVAATLVEERLG